MTSVPSERAARSAPAGTAATGGSTTDTAATTDRSTTRSTTDAAARTERTGGDRSTVADAVTWSPGQVRAWAVLAWLVVVVVALAWGTELLDRPAAKLRAAPFAGSWRWDVGPRLLPALLLGAATIAVGPTLARRLPWRALLAATAGVAACWTVLLAASRGWDRVTEPLTTRHEYEPFAAGVTDISDLLARYVDELGTFPVHVQGHPPGPVVLAWGLDRFGLGGAGWLAVLAIAGWGLAVAAALVALREVAGDDAARRAAPAVAVLPAAVWAGTSLDALFAGATATASALIVLGLVRRSAGHALAAGVVAGVALLCTYGAGAYLLVGFLAGVALVVTSPTSGSGAPGSASAGVPGPDPAARVGAVADPAVPDPVPAPAIADRAVPDPAVPDPARADPARSDPAVPDPAVRDVLGREAPDQKAPVSDGPALDGPARGRLLAALPLVAASAVGVVGVLAIAAVAGFWWPDGLAATGRAYWDGIGGERPAAYLALVGNPAALALATGPAVAVGLASTLAGGRRDRRLAVLPAAALLAVLLADLSQLSRGETERIWLPFVPWLALAAPGDRRGWLAAQVALAVGLQAALDSPW